MRCCTQTVSCRSHQANMRARAIVIRIPLSKRHLERADNVNQGSNFYKRSRFMKGGSYPCDVWKGWSCQSETGCFSSHYFILWFRRGGAVEGVSRESMQSGYPICIVSRIYTPATSAANIQQDLSNRRGTKLCQKPTNTVAQNMFSLSLSIVFLFPLSACPLTYPLSST